MPTSFIYALINKITTDPLMIFILAVSFGLLGLLLSVVYRS